MLSAFLAALVALPIAALATYALVRLRPSRGLAQPVSGRWHEHPTPALGGVAILAGLVVSLAVSVVVGAIPLDAQMLGLFAGLAILFATGLVDDMYPFGPRFKLVAQLAAGGLAMGTGTVIEIVGTPWLAYPLTLLWLVAVSNAFNLLDNIDGLAGLVAVISTALFAASGVLADDPLVVALAAAVAFACLGFLPFNFRRGRPASIFMGDSGSQMLGFALGAIGLLSSWREASQAIAVLLVPLLVLAVPILDTALVTLVRLREGRPIHVGGTDHASHRLVGYGLSAQRAVLVLAALAAIVGGATLGLVQLDRPFLTIAGVFLAVTFLVRFGLFLSRIEGGASSARDRAPVPPRRAFVLGRTAIELLLDGLLIVGAYALAYAVRFQGPEERFAWENTFWKSLALLLAARLAALFLFGVYKTMWRHAGFRDAVSIAYAVVASGAVVIVVLTMSGRFEGYSRGVFVIEAILCAAFLVASRLGERWISTTLTSFLEARRSSRVLIVGAGRGGTGLLRELRDRPGHAVVGFLDDDVQKHGMRIQRVPILGPCSLIDAALDRVRPDVVVVTIPRAPHDTLRHVVSTCESRNVACRFALRDSDLDPAAFLDGHHAAAP